MTQPTSPIDSLVAQITGELVFGQVLIRRLADGFYELRHVIDAKCDSAVLKLLAEDKIRPLAQFDSGGAFRPLKSGPNLSAGWRILARDNTALATALVHFYPGAVADWFAARAATPPVTSYREFTARQTGMYRITTMLDDDGVAAVIDRCCEPHSCLKRRLWSVASLPPDAWETKSVIPCLEPCAILLESARKAARVAQSEQT